MNVFWVSKYIITSRPELRSVYNILLQLKTVHRCLKEVLVRNNSSSGHKQLYALDNALLSLPGILLKKTFSACQVL